MLTAHASGMTEAALYIFNGSTTDGGAPLSLVQGSDGNFYGTTVYGGASSQGAVFKVTPAGVETLLHSFGSVTGDGSGALDTKLIRGSDGNFYGVTALGGAKGEGTVFEVTPAGIETVLYSFGSNGQTDAELPNSLVEGRDGNFYGTAAGGTKGVGALFKIVPGAVPLESVVYSFGTAATDSDGQYPNGLIQGSGSDDSFYGITSGGGGPIPGASASSSYSGILFKFDATTAALTVIHPFGGSQASGQNPGKLVEGGDGNFYVNTNGGKGGVSQVTPAGVETVLHVFGADPADGATPADLIAGQDGNLYGITSFGGGNAKGTVFEVTPAGVETILYAFGTTNADGNRPSALIQGSDGNFYGTTTQGGAPADSCDAGPGILFALGSTIKGGATPPAAGSGSCTSSGGVGGSSGGGGAFDWFSLMMLGSVTGLRRRMRSRDMACRNQ